MPPRSSKQETKGGWRAIALSLLVHAAIVGAAVMGWFVYKHEPPPPTTLAIEATVVDERALKGVQPIPEPTPPPAQPEPVPEPEPEPEPTPPEEQGPPKPDPAEVERRLEEERLAAEKVEQEERVQLELKQREEAEKLEDQKQAAARAAAQKVAVEKAAAEKRAAERKRVEDAVAAKKAADEKARRAIEAELRRSMEAEERGNALRTSDEASRWHAAIVARIQRAWIKPPSAQPGISCTVSVQQVPGGEVTSVRVDSCTGGDAALRESVEAAVLRASPLPAPPDPRLFERNLILIFEPK
ncbi:MAG: cell envelope integrity protein TolA [Steroidobacteraceae bacterium]|nr:cell envelope integrity protein TolA [Steroidobacteraceae bacterium]